MWGVKFYIEVVYWKPHHKRITKCAKYEMYKQIKESVFNEKHTLTKSYYGLKKPQKLLIEFVAKVNTQNYTSLWDNERQLLQKKLHCIYDLEGSLNLC